MADNLEEKKMSADGHSSVPTPTTPAGGEAKNSPTGIDLDKEVDPEAETVNDGVTKKTNKPEVAVEAYDKKKMKKEEDDYEDDDMDDDEEEMEESFNISSLFEGLDLSEDFKSKAGLVFEAAVNEAASAKAAQIAESLEESLQEQFQTSLDESLEEIVENLDGYLDYVIKEWMEENEVAVESGIKVEMSDSLMTGLKELFYEHNVDLDEEKIDVVAELEEELLEYKNQVNKVINERIELEEEVQALRANKVFETMTEGLSDTQKERFRVLSEKLDFSDLGSYESDLSTLKESFFKTKSSNVIVEDINQEGDEIIVEDTAKSAPASQYDNINALAAALKNYK